MNRSILDRRLILVAGKGGVGRSTVAASIAAATARRGRRTLLFESNANDRYGRFFGAAPVGPSVTRLADNLYAVNTNPGAALEEYGLMILKFRRVYRMVFENRLTRYFLRAIPGLDDYAVLGKAWFHTTEEKRGAPVWDTVVFDLPASGHSLSMLRIPYVILETVPEGPLTRDARRVRSLLTDPGRTSLVLVTLAEEMPANEARELTTALDEGLGIQVAHVVVNQVYPNRFPHGSPAVALLDRLVAQLEGDDRDAADALSPRFAARARPGAPDAPGTIDADVAALAQHAELARRRRSLNEEYLQELRDAIPSPQTELPLLFSPTLGPPEIQTLSAIVEGGLERPA